MTAQVQVKTRLGLQAHEFFRYAVTAAFVALCLVLRQKWQWNGYSFFLFVPAVFLGATLFGKGQAIFAAALAALVAVFFCLDPIYTLRISSYHVPSFVLYLVVCVAIVGVTDWWRAARRARLAVSEAGTAAPASSAGGRRFDGLDFWRGFVLVSIFINHIPGNIFEYATHRNIGFSDAAEAFVFLSGVALAFAYGRRFQSDRLSVLLALLRRVFTLYGVHIALSLAGFAIFAAGSYYWGAPVLLKQHGRDLFGADPELFLAALFSLGHQLGYFNILPLYMVLILFVPAYLWLAARDIRLMLAVSFGFYLLVRVFHWNLPNWPMPGTWFLNPLAWQLAMALGIAVGIGLSRGKAVPVNRWLLMGAATLLFLAMIVSQNGFGRLTELRAALGPLLDIDKGVLGMGRLSHFLALAYLVYVCDVTGWLRRTPVFRPLVVIGRHGLMIFALLSLLDAGGQVLMTTMRTSFWFDIVVIGGGVLILYAAARLADAGRMPKRRPAPAQEAALAPA